MKKRLKNLLTQGNHLEIILILLMFLLTFSTFNFLFSGTKEGGFYQNFLAAAIGTLLTVVITSLLIKQQGKKEEVKEQNVEVFKERLKQYKAVTNLLIEVLEDKKVDEDEAKQLRNAIYNLALISKKETVEVISKFLRHRVVGDQSEVVGFFEVISAFRAELNLEGIDILAASDIDAIESLLDIGFDRIEVFRETKRFLEEIRKDVASAIFESVDKNALQHIYVGEVEGSIGAKIAFDLDNSRKNPIALLTYEFSIDYPTTEDFDEIAVVVTIGFVLEMKGEGRKQRKFYQDQVDNIHLMAKEQGFEFVDYGEDQETEDYANHFTKTYPVNFKKMGRGEIQIVDMDVSAEIIEDLFRLEGIEIPDSSEDSDSL